jgi:alpha-2-macroglobulin-like protein
MKKLKEGYKHLVSFEAKKGGYEWFGSDPGHEALSAYGLMQFDEMLTVMPEEVDMGMMERVKGWLLAKRDGKGSFNMKLEGLDSFGKPPADIADAYILWALT